MTLPTTTWTAESYPTTTWSAEVVGAVYLLAEDGTPLKTESGEYIILEYRTTSWTAESMPTTSWTNE